MTQKVNNFIFFFNYTLLKKQIYGLIIALIIILYFFTGCATDKDNEVSYPVVNYISTTFISEDYIFENESLSAPTAIRNLHKTNDIVVADANNKCIYIFSEAGEFKRKFGRVGQGPGEFIRIGYIDVDNEDNIYIHDSNNNRMTIFSSVGKLINTFPLYGYGIKFSITPNREILVNIPKNGYYFTLYSQQGNLLRNIGLIPQYNKREDINITFAEGFPFQDEKGTFFIFLQHMPYVKKYNAEGELIEEHNIRKKLPGYDKFDSKYEPPEKYGTGSVLFNLYQEIIFRDGYFYIPKQHTVTAEKEYVTEFSLYEFDKYFNISRLLFLKSKVDFDVRTFSIRFEILNKTKEIIMSHYKVPSITKFIMENK